MLIPRACLCKCVQILFDEERRAVGVQYWHRGRMYTVHTRKEVVLSAGTVASPQILMLSGIGPAAHLHDLGVRNRKVSPKSFEILSELWWC